MSGKRYTIELTTEEREQLNRLIRGGKHSARIATRARILLRVDEGCKAPQVAAALDVSEGTVYRIKRRYAEEGLDGVLHDRVQANRYRKLDDKAEAHLIALACSDAPEGRQRWTLELVADQMVELGLVETDLFANVLAPYLVGMDTSASVCAFMLYALLKHPEILEQMRAEVDEMYQDGGLTLEGLRRLDVTHRVAAVATVVGPVMGAFVAEWLSWHWVFLFIALAGVPALALTAWIYPRSTLLTRPEGLDYPGMAALALAVGPVALALSSVGVLYSWDAPQSIGLLAFGLAMAGLFVAIECRAGSPIMPLGIYRDRAVAVAMVVTLLTAASLHGFVLFLPLYFQVELGASVSQAGSLLAPMLLGMVVGAILAGQMLSRTGGRYRMQLLVSTALMAGGMYLFATLGGDGFARNSPILYSQTYLMITALGFGGVVATLSVAVQNAVPYRDVGVATAALQFCLPWAA